MTGWETFDRLCREHDLAEAIKELPDQRLHDLRECLAKLKPTNGVPAMMSLVATLEAADRWQGGGK
jgi:hypothetical protein